jgi:hypothetical protein
LPFSLPTGDATTSEIDFSIIEDAPLEALPVPLPETVPRVNDVEPPPRLATLVPRPMIVPSLDPIVEPTFEPQTPPETIDDDERERDRRRSRVALDPASVAAAGIVFEDDPPVGSARGRASDQTHEEALERALGGALSDAANARPHVSRRGPPRLRPRRDGSYAFHGHVFDAVILPDGRVQFSDRGGVEMDAPHLGANGLLPQGTFDISDSIERARGQDPYRHERQWFMTETEELRERLSAEADAQLHSRGIARLNGHLRQIWRGRGTERDRRAQIFSLWDDCAEDDVGRRARAAIVTFVRQTLPADSEAAFTRRELDTLNRQRTSRETFAPY